jgi:hypothetical protein
MLLLLLQFGSDCPDDDHHHIFRNGKFLDSQLHCLKAMGRIKETFQFSSWQGEGFFYHPHLSFLTEAVSISRLHSAQNGT